MVEALHVVCLTRIHTSIFTSIMEGFLRRSSVAQTFGWGLLLEEQ